MADDPREEVLAKRLAADENDDAHWTGYLREAGLHIAALNALDPLRALLADEDELVEFATQARYEASQINVARDFPGSKALRSWSDFPELAKVNWRAETRKLCGPVLAALREVAGL